jgi:hypothetical protein
MNTIGQKPVNLNVNANDLATLMCSCGKPLFEKVFMFKVLPSIMSPTGKAMLVGIEHIKCINCGAAYSAEEATAYIQGGKVSLQ